MTTLLEQIGQAGANHELLAKTVMAQPALVPELLEGLQSDTARIKFGSAKILRLIAERCPELLYSHFDVFVKLLEHKNKILLWEGVIVLSHLAQVDKQNKFESIFEKYFAHIPGPVMITAANVIGGAARIAVARPDWADRIAAEILKVSRGKYQTTECRNVAIGHAVESFGQFFHLLKNKKPVLNFVRNQLKNTRNAVRTKAQKFLAKHNPSKGI